MNCTSAKKNLILKNQGDAILHAFMKDVSNKNVQDKNIENLFDILAGFDPTKNKKFVQWIVNQYVKGYFFLEDGYKVTDLLKRFLTNYYKIQQRDINKYSFASLQDALEQYNVPEKLKEINSTGLIKTIISKGDFTVIQVLDRQAAIDYGRNTSWCTANEEHNAFDNYKDDLFIIMYKDRKWQFHYESNQFMDERDRPISKKDIDLLSDVPGYTDFLNFCVERYYKKYLPKPEDVA
jgi:ribosomal protein S18